MAKPFPVVVLFRAIEEQPQSLWGRGPGLGDIWGQYGLCLCPLSFSGPPGGLVWAFVGHSVAPGGLDDAFVRALDYVGRAGYLVWLDDRLHGFFDALL